MTSFSRRELATLAAGLGTGLLVLSGTGVAADNEASEGHGTVAGGMMIYLGVIPSELIASNYALDTPEYKMHGGPPKGQHFHHVMIALYDEKGGQRITDATVKATIRPLGMNGVTKNMAPFDVSGAMTYCNYFDMPIYGKYRVDVEITRPGASQPTTAQLLFDHTPGN